MKKKAIIILIALLIAAVFFVYLKGKNINTRTTIEIGGQKGETGPENNPQDNLDQDQGSDSTVAPDIKVAPSDCDNSCSRFKADNEVEYCQQICGLNTPDDSQDDSESSDCGTKSGIFKDYCLKDQAIKKSDFGACDGINDSSIQKTCRNRITEDLLEKQQ